jgi:hypothetical protein
MELLPAVDALKMLGAASGGIEASTCGGGSSAGGRGVTMGGGGRLLAYLTSELFHHPPRSVNTQGQVLHRLHSTLKLVAVMS